MAEYTNPQNLTQKCKTKKPHCELLEVLVVFGAARFRRGLVSARFGFGLASVRSWLGSVLRGVGSARARRGVVSVRFGFGFA